MSDWDRETDVKALVQTLRRDGWDLSLPRYVQHDVCLRTQEEADALAPDLRSAGYVVEGPWDDPDYERWEFRVREAKMMLVAADAISAAQARLEALILPRGGWLNGVAVRTREGEG